MGEIEGKGYSGKRNGSVGGGRGRGGGEGRGGGRGEGGNGATVATVASEARETSSVAVGEEKVTCRTSWRVHVEREYVQSTVSLIA